MALEEEDLRMLLCRSWLDMRQWSRRRVLELRAACITEINAQACTSIPRWPPEVRRLFFRQTPPLNNRETRQLAVFFIGNYFSPYVCGVWLLTAFALSPQPHRRLRLVARRLLQFLWIIRNAINFVGVWTYFDVEEGQTRRLQQWVFEEVSDEEED